MRVDSGSTDGEDCNVVECQRSRHDRDVNKTGSRGVAEVGSRQVEKVDDQKELGQPEVRPDPEVNGAEQKQVVDDKVGADVGSGGGVSLIFGIKVPRVPELSKKENDPVDGDNDRVQSKRRVHAVVLAEDGITVVLALGWHVEGVVECRDDKNKPCHGRGNSVSVHTTLWVRLTTQKWIYLLKVSFTSRVCIEVARVELEVSS